MLGLISLLCMHKEKLYIIDQYFSSHYHNNIKMAYIHKSTNALNPWKYLTSILIN